jgi:hypothetical protein
MAYQILFYVFGQYNLMGLMVKNMYFFLKDQNCRICICRYQTNSLTLTLKIIDYYYYYYYYYYK